MLADLSDLRHEGVYALKGVFMSDAIVQAIIAAGGALAGSGLGVIASSRLTNYRLEQLEGKVSDLIKRDDDVTILKEQMKGVIDDVKELKKH